MHISRIKTHEEWKTHMRAQTMTRTPRNQRQPISSSRHHPLQPPKLGSNSQAQRQGHQLWEKPTLAKSKSYNLI
ncbi:hypothetical protein RJ641_025808 [Dillenia turbinata]|uniref:Uncharacterized protein n=1 Tax=Dillenia turbinata TaxID=194707 RepID=A0AAN8WA02_9MAGN